MFSCYICKVHHRTCPALFQHLKFHHGLYPGRSLRLKCGEPGCSSVFYTYYGFKKHLRVHGNCAAGNCLTSDIVDSLGRGNILPDSNSQQIEDPPVSFPTPVDNGQLLDMCSSIVAQVQASGVSESTVQCLVGSMEELVNDVHAEA